MNVDKTVIDINNMSCGYGESIVLKDINLQVKRGDIIGIAGPNGAGKTTLLKALLGIIPVAKGEIEIKGTAIDAISKRDLAKRIAVVPQETSPAFRIKVEEMISLGRTPFMNIAGWLSKEDKEKIHAIALKTGVACLFERYFDELSGGEKQLVVMTRCLVQEPHILVLDEALANLDVSHKMQIIDLITRSNAQENLTIIFVSHDINQIIRFCKKIVFIKEQRIRYEGNMKDVVTGEVLYDVFNVHADIKQKDDDIEYVTFSHKKNKRKEIS